MQYSLIILDEVWEQLGNAGLVSSEFLVKLITEAEKKKLPIISSIDCSETNIFSILQLEQIVNELFALENLFKDDEKIPFSIFKNAAISVIEQERYHHLRIAKQT